MVSLSCSSLNPNDIATPRRRRRPPLRLLIDSETLLHEYHYFGHGHTLIDRHKLSSTLLLDYLAVDLSYIVYITVRSMFDFDGAVAARQWSSIKLSNDPPPHPGALEPSNEFNMKAGGTHIPTTTNMTERDLLDIYL